MTQTLDDLLAQNYPALNQLLISVLMGQYHPDRLVWAVNAFVKDNDPEDYAAAIREIDAASGALATNYEALSKIACYALESPDDARRLLSALRQRLAAA